MLEMIYQIWNSAKLRFICQKCKNPEQLVSEFPHHVASIAPTTNPPYILFIYSSPNQHQKWNKNFACMQNNPHEFNNLFYLHK